MGLAEPLGEVGPVHRLLWIAIALRARATGVRSNINQRLTQNWHGLGESDCLIKTKHCDGQRVMLTQCDFCPVLCFVNETYGLALGVLVVFGFFRICVKLKAVQ